MLILAAKFMVICYAAKENEYTLVICLLESTAFVVVVVHNPGFASCVASGELLALREPIKLALLSFHEDQMGYT